MGFTEYDFVVCGSGSSGSVVAGRLSENPNVSVLLVEAGGTDDVPEVTEAIRWASNIGGERDWGFQGQPNPHLGGRSVHLAMGRVLGGGSSINALVWARGHQQDWDSFAADVGDPAWGYASVLDIYRRIEDWHGSPDPEYRGSGGPVLVQPALDPNPVAPATLEGARSVGIPVFENPNGRMMEVDGGAAIIDLVARAGKRQSVYRSYVSPHVTRPNLTVITGAVVARVTFDGGSATGVEIVHRGKTLRIVARAEVVLCLGAINTPRVLMQSGIGDATQLRTLGIRVVQHLPGVGRNLQDHVAFDSIWEYRDPLPPRNNGGEATIFWKSQPSLSSPDILICEAEFPKTTPENAARFGLPGAGFTLFGAVAHPRSRGFLKLTGRGPFDPVEIHDNFLAEPEDWTVAKACVELCREIGNSAPLRPFVKREVMPGPANGTAREIFIRNAAASFFHLSGTARMGRDDESVVDSALKVHGIEKLRVADGSVMPRVTTGNTMAPCVIIGERAVEILEVEHGLGSSAVA